MHSRGICRFIFMAILLSACSPTASTPLVAPTSRPTLTPHPTSTPIATHPSTSSPTVDTLSPSQTPPPSFTPSPPTEPPPKPTLPASERHTSFPAFVYLNGPGITYSNFDGSSKTNVPEIPNMAYPGAGQDVAERTGTLVLLSHGSSEPGHDSLWVVPMGESPREIAHPEIGYIEFCPITLDGSMIAYGLHDFQEGRSQLWVVNADGTGNRLLVDNTEQYITDPGPFRLSPVAWSADQTKIYLTTNTDSEATPVGLYVADLATGRITKALTPQVTLWGLSFSADRSKIVYTTFQWVPTESFPQPGPPYTLNITDLKAGKTTVLLQSEVDRYENPILSPDGKTIAFTVLLPYPEGHKGLYVLNLVNGGIHTVFDGQTGVSIHPAAWLSNGIIVFDLKSTTSERYSGTGIYTIETDGASLHQVEELVGYILGVVQPENP